MIVPVPAFKDNYIWLLNEGNNAWVVDPGDAKPVMQVLAENNWNLTGILLTHHHLDHSGGIRSLLNYANNIPVFASHNSEHDYVTDPVKEGDTVPFGSHTLSVLEIPGHTLDHVAFFNNELLFCGDTLFSAGCGRVFEGTYEQMYQSLCRLNHLNNDTNIYCGHEYTLANLTFAQHVEPENAYIAEKIAAVKLLLEEGQCTLPSTLNNEKRMNPFLRCDDKNIIRAVEQYANKTLSTPVEVFQHLREWKNNF
jgi:hydroxyacylglutathione hydrolase